MPLTLPIVLARFSRYHRRIRSLSQMLKCDSCNIQMKCCYHWIAVVGNFSSTSPRADTGKTRSAWTICARDLEPIFFPGATDTANVSFRFSYNICSSSFTNGNIPVRGRRSVVRELTGAVVSKISQSPSTDPTQSSSPDFLLVLL
jgi:hypothetical protein